MSTFKLMVHGKWVKFQAKTRAQALFARDRHIEYLRDAAKKRIAEKRAALAKTKEIIEQAVKKQAAA